MPQPQTKRGTQIKLTFQHKVKTARGKDKKRSSRYYMKFALYFRLCMKANL